MRLAVYSDFPYRREGEALYAEQPFARFLFGLRPHVERLVLIGRLERTAGRHPYRLPADVELAPLPHYERLSDPLRALRTGAVALVRFWRALDGIDTVWLLGPHPLGLAFAGLTVLRRRRLALGVRQDLPSYARNRHPGRRLLLRTAELLDWCWRLLGRRCSVVAIGEELAGHYRAARRLLPAVISLVQEDDIAGAEVAARRRYDGEISLLTVGRLDAEKNPLLLADILALLWAGGGRWHLRVCGDGPEADSLARRLREAGVEGHAELLGHVPPQGGLTELYRSSHLFLHISWTEGMPQVLLEAFAARLPVVATAVGGVPALAEGAALLVSPGDAQQAATALRQLAADAALRSNLIDHGVERAREHTLGAETARVVRFLGGEEVVGAT